MDPPYDPIASLIELWRHREAQGRAAGSVNVTDAATLGPAPPSSAEYPLVLIQAAVVKLGDRTTDGQLVKGVSVAWFEVIKRLERDPEFLYKVDWRKLEEIVAGAYERDGWPDVVLTPRSRDGGRDVIATRPGFGSVRIIDQVKAYAPGHLVSADEVRSVLGVLAADRNVSKGVITTSSDFAPGIQKAPELQAFIPHRLELKDGDRLREWLIEASKNKS